MNDLIDDFELILKDDTLDDEAVERGKVELIEERLSLANWPEVFNWLIRLLTSSRRLLDQRVAMAVLWGATLDKRAMDPNLTSAVLTHLFLSAPMVDENDQNLAWSIVTKLKGKGYLSNYDPQRDPDVQKALLSIQWT